MSMEMRGRVVIVTGAAGGVGQAVTRMIRDRGGWVVAEDLSQSVVDIFADDDGVATVVGDCADIAVADRAVALARETFGHLDGLVNNAGRFLLKPIADTSVEEWDALMTTNVRGAFVHTRQALPALTDAKGTIVNVASISGLVGFPGQTGYTATKGALVQLTRTSAIEFAPAKIRVNAVAPGSIATGFMDEAMADNPDKEGTMRAISASHPLDRIASPEEVAEAIVFLLSERSRAITGAILPVDGGYTAQ